MNTIIVIISKDKKKHPLLDGFFSSKRFNTQIGVPKDSVGTVPRAIIVESLKEAAEVSKWIPETDRINVPKKRGRPKATVNFTRLILINATTTEVKKSDLFDAFYDIQEAEDDVSFYLCLERILKTDKDISSGRQRWNIKVPV